MKAITTEPCFAMKLLSRRTSLLALAAFLVGLATTTRSQSWETILTIPDAHVPPNPSILPIFSASPTNKSELLLGAAAGSSFDLYRLNLADNSWQGQVLFDPPRGVRELAFDPGSQSLFAVRYNEDPFTGRQIWKSSDQGGSWVVVDSFAGSLSGFAADDLGNLYISGTTNLANGGTATWFVRKSSDHGTTWNTVDRVLNASPAVMHFVPGAQGGLFAAGNRVSGGDLLWTVRRSRDGGATWTQVESFYRSGKYTSATAIASDGQGRIYVAGYSGPDPLQWEVRMSENGGASWKTISPPGATAQYNASSAGIALDLSGNLILSGLLDAWAVARRSPDGAWQDVEFPFGTESGWVPSSATGVAVDAAGNLFVVGRLRSGWPGTITESLAVQKLAASVLPPLTLKRVDNSLTVSWPAAVSGAKLESTDTLDPGAPWAEAPTPPVVIGDKQTVTAGIEPGPKFFRLRKP